jgi:Ala-tRNA(Pro) deacylase
MCNKIPANPDALLKILQEIGVSYQIYNHEPIFTVEQGAPLKVKIPGVHCRNLFVRDKKDRMFLIVAANETMVDLKGLAGILGAGRLSFGSPDRLMQYLGITPGSVCPFCAINDKDHKVEIILDSAMMRAETVCYHPLDNAQTISLTPPDLLKFFAYTGHDPKILDLSGRGSTY